MKTREKDLLSWIPFKRVFYTTILATAITERNTIHFIQMMRETHIGVIQWQNLIKRDAVHQLPNKITYRTNRTAIIDRLLGCFFKAFCTIIRIWQIIQTCFVSPTFERHRCPSQSPGWREFRVAEILWTRRFFDKPSLSTSEFNKLPDILRVSWKVPELIKLKLKDKMTNWRR